PSGREGCSSVRSTLSKAAFAVTTTNGEATKVCASTTPASERVSGSPAAMASSPIGVPGPKPVSKTILPTVGGSTSGSTTTARTTRFQRVSARASQYASGNPNTVERVALIAADTSEVVAALTTGGFPIRAITSESGTERNNETSGTR